MKKINICTHHEEALKSLNRLSNILTYCWKLPDNKTATCKAYIDEARKHIYKAKSCGSSMEGRLKVYREGIEDMGFKRYKKGRGPK